ncbi:MAG TPA: SPOR domain-containing protein [Terriglobia bacterium]|nr:SPOR domain-containing protein [Terriglobia bacterium]
MGPGRESKRDERGLSARYLVVVFLMGVAACAVFFSLGFLVGYNERPFKGATTTEQVTPSPVIPPTVNPPLEEVPSPGKSPPPATAAKGATPARQEATKPAEEPKAASPAAATPSGPVPSGFAVQVAASRSKSDAENLVKELGSRGYRVFLVTPEYAKAGDNLYRVQVGPFATREDAEKARDKLAKEGFKPFIRH